MKPVSRDWDEFCYPFIYEDSPICDFEILSDELCCRVGLVLTMSLDLEPQVRDDVSSACNRTYLSFEWFGERKACDYRVRFSQSLKQDYHSHKRPIRRWVSKALCCPVDTEVSSELTFMPAAKLKKWYVHLVMY